MRIERAEVDSLRLGEPVGAFWTTAALGAAAALAALCYFGWCDSGGT